MPQLARLCSKLVCYFSNRLQYREGAACFLPEDVDPRPCTHLIRAFAGMDSHQLSSIEWNEETLYKEFNGLQMWAAVEGVGMGGRESRCLLSKPETFPSTAI